MLTASIPCRWLRRVAAWLALCCAAALWGGPAAAGEADPQHQFTTALEHFDAGRYDEALPLFRGALAASGSPNARLYVGRCLHKLGRLAAAYDEIHATMREATARASEEAKYEQTRDAAAAELALLEPKVGKLVIALSGPTDGAEVELDGEPVALERLGSPITVEPGEHAVVVTLAQGRELRGVAALDGGQTKTITLSAAGGGATEPTPAAPPEDAGDERTTGGGVRVAGFVIAGLGVAGMAVFGITGALAADEFSTLEAECGELRCADGSYADVVDRGKTLETVANVSLVAGIVGIVGGVTMIVFGGPSEAEPTQASIGLSPDGAMLSWRGAF